MWTTRLKTGWLMTSPRQALCYMTNAKRRALRAHEPLAFWSPEYSDPIDVLISDFENLGFLWNASPSRKGVFLKSNFSQLL